MKNKDAYYFSHDSNAKDDPKCLMLIEEMGLEGYGIFWVLIETLRDQTEFKAPLKIVPALARRYNTSKEKMMTVITRYDLFMIEDEAFFFSNSLIKRMQFYLDKKKQKSIAGIKGNLVKHGHLSKKEIQSMSDDEVIDIHNKLNGFSHSDRSAIAIKGNKRKANKRIVKAGNKLPEPPTLDEVSKYFSENGYSVESAHKAFHYYEDDRLDRNGKVWKDSNGKTVRSWKQKMRAVWFKPENKSSAEEFNPLFSLSIMENGHGS